MIHGGVNQERMGALALSVWRRRGADTLTRPLALGRVLDAGAPIGLCTTLRFLLGRSPADMEATVGPFGDGTLPGGAEIFVVAPLPEPGAFDLRGYAPRIAPAPDGVPAFPGHPLYPPNLGAPLWDVSLPRTALVWIATVPRGAPFRFELRRLPPVP